MAVNQVQALLLADFFDVFLYIFSVKKNVYSMEVYCMVNLMKLVDVVHDNMFSYKVSPP